MRIAPSSIMAVTLALTACGQTPEKPVAPSPSVSEQPVAGPKRNILAFGDSLFAGLGVGREHSYPAQLEAALRKDGINARIANAGVSGDTSAAGLQRLAFTLDAQLPAPDLAILELGANDMLRGLKPGETRANMIAMLDEFAKRKIPVLLMGMRAAPNYGSEYQQAFDAIYAELGKRDGVTLVPFWLESVYRRPELFQADHLHPTVEGIGVLVRATTAEVEASLGPAR